MTLNGKSRMMRVIAQKKGVSDFTSQWLSLLKVFIILLLLPGCRNETGGAPNDTNPSNTVQDANASPERLKWVGCGITRKAFMAELAKAFQDNTGIHVDISGGGATRGIRDVAKGYADLGGSCRHALDVPEEADVVLLPVAWDALVVIVHRENPLDNITLDQLNAVFRGDVIHWADLGCPRETGRIKIHAREGKISGVGFMSRILLFHDQEMDFAAASIHKSSGPLEEAIVNDPQGIAITGIASAIRRPGLKILKLNGIQPSPQNIINGSYDLIRPLYIVIHKSNKDVGPAAKFVRYALSLKGQQVIADTGTVPTAKVGPALYDIYYEKMALARQEIVRLKSGREYMESLMDLTLEELIEINVDQGLLDEPVSK